MLKTTISLLAICALATPGFAQTAKKKLPPRAPYSAALPNTLAMTCADATKLVLSKPEGITLRTGANRWDHYFHDAEYCPNGPSDLVPQFVQTKDNGVCNIGYTCMSVSSDN
jgi:hypothetical protein